MENGFPGFPEVFQGFFRAVIPRIVVAREERLEAESLKVVLQELVGPFAARLAVEELLRHLAGFRRLDGAEEQGESGDAKI